MNDDLHARLDKFESKLDKIADAVASIAVQDQRLITLERDTALLYTKMDTVEKFQASCPRDTNQNQLKAVWVFVCAIVLSIIGMFVRGQQ